MKLSLTKDTLIAFLVVVTLGGMALGLADETEAALNLEEMAKLGIHRMPNGEWMQEAEPAAAGEAAPITAGEAGTAATDHSGHIAQPNEAPDQNTSGDNQSPDGGDVPGQIDHEAMGH